ncbi:MAG: Ppx/GppA family phosphatase [Dysgonamonadaceae bacterium]|jgi:exopolyphosphatase/guanosine-5'-triphosphate,3'-diphosphate pyrophosphatase|nr:Ppx/GppA family phosphatase [Dysgonamonadaceae bacterium]
MNNVHFAAIDIGSNAVRLTVKSIGKNADGVASLEQDLLVRFPLRLGKDAFTKGKISKKKAGQLMLLMKSFHGMLKIFSVIAFRACATSAMRDAGNGKEIIDKIQKKIGLPIEIISGEEEARIIYETHIERELGAGNDYLYMDVGGGSTQISFIRAGKLIYSHSFNIGTVRMMNNRIRKKDRITFFSTLNDLRRQYPDIKLVGSGGNINKLYKLLQEDKNSFRLNVERLKQLNRELSLLSVEERMKKYRIKRDRAEVIGYASYIFVNAAKVMRIDDIIVPSISISDGIINKMFIDYLKEKEKSDGENANNADIQKIIII